MEKDRIFTSSFAGAYSHYIVKAEKKGATKEEVDTPPSWVHRLVHRFRNSPLPGF